MTDLTTDSSAGVTPPSALRTKLDGLSAVSMALTQEHRKKQTEQEKLQEQIRRAPLVDSALQELSDQMFDNIVRLLEEKLTIALQEVLEQPISLKAVASYRSATPPASIFTWSGDGNPEDIMKGQGGSVANVLSVGLRMFALATLDPAKHRRFLVLDEQDCWLRPELVPKLVKIVRDACDALGFQVMMISHHDHRLFQDYAGKVYQFVPKPDGTVEVVLNQSLPASIDS